MEIDLFCVLPESVLIPRIQENCARYPARIRTVPAHDGHAVLIGGGPSVRDRISAIQKRRAAGQTLFALNGAGNFLNGHGIVPHYQVILDPQDFLTRYVADADSYLIASQCHPAVLAASPKPPILWHVATEGREEVTPCPYQDGECDCCFVGGGFSVGLCSMCLVYAMGYRHIHLYGYDSSISELGSHAYPDPVTGQAFGGHTDVYATVGGRRFQTTLQLAKQAQTFLKVSDDLIDAGCTVTVDCDGLLQAVVQENNRLNAAAAA